jgi:hypothetical protein
VPVVVPSPPETDSGPEFPPDLSLVVDAWDHLPEVIKAGIIAMIQVARGSAS